MSESLLPDFRRYAQLIESQLTASAAAVTFTPSAESTSAVQVERGLVLPYCFTEASRDDAALLDRLIELSRWPRAAEVAVVDAAGHHRPVYRPLLIYAWLVAFRLRYETLPQDQFGRWDEALRAWSDVLEGRLGDIGPDDTAAIPAARGDLAAEAAWTAAALHVAGKVFIRDAW